MVRQSEAARQLDRTGLPLPKDEVILSLRQQADVKCQYNSTSSKPCDPSQTACLFKISEDPCEQNNLIFDFPNVVQVFQSVNWIVGNDEPHYLDVRGNFTAL